MKVLFKNIQGLIFLSIVVAFSVNANAQMYGNMWGTGFSPGMQGCMAETEAFDKYGDIKASSMQYPFSKRGFPSSWKVSSPKNSGG